MARWEIPEKSATLAKILPRLFGNTVRFLHCFHPILQGSLFLFVKKYDDL